MQNKRQYRLRLSFSESEKEEFLAGHGNSDTTLTPSQYARELVLGNIPNSHALTRIENMLVGVQADLETHRALAHYAAMCVAQTVVNFEETPDLKGQEDHWVKLFLEIRSNKISGGVMDPAEIEKILATKTMSRFARKKKAQRAATKKASS